MERYPLMRERTGKVETFSLKQLKQLLNAPDKGFYGATRLHVLALINRNRDTLN